MVISFLYWELTVSGVSLVSELGSSVPELCDQ